MRQVIVAHELQASNPVHNTGGQHTECTASSNLWPSNSPVLGGTSVIRCGVAEGFSTDRLPHDTVSERESIVAILRAVEVPGHRRCAREQPVAGCSILEAADERNKNGPVVAWKTDVAGVLGCREKVSDIASRQKEQHTPVSNVRIMCVNRVVASTLPEPALIRRLFHGLCH